MLFSYKKTKNCKVLFDEVKLFDFAYLTCFVFEQLNVKQLRCTYLPVN